MRTGKKLYLLCLACTLMLVLGGCGKDSTVQEQEGKQKESNQTEGNQMEGGESVSKPPEIVLTDILSSQMNAYTIQPNSYNWNYRKDDEFTGAVTDGFHPLDEAAQEQIVKITVPKYKDMETTAYHFSLEQEPDEMMVYQWKIEDIGNFEADMTSTQNYGKPVTSVELEPGYVYEIVLIWEEENLEQNGFFGQAGYTLRTESAGEE